MCPEQEEHLDWTEIAKLKPKGYVKVSEDKQVLYGPVDKVVVYDDYVWIIVMWLARWPTDSPHITGWVAVSDRPIAVCKFLNFHRPFQIEKSKGVHCVRWGEKNVLHLDDVHEITKEDVEGF